MGHYIMFVIKCRFILYYYVCYNNMYIYKCDWKRKTEYGTHETNHDRYGKVQLQSIIRNELQKVSMVNSRKPIERLKTRCTLLWCTETSKPHTHQLHVCRSAIIFEIMPDGIFQ